jgi:hypothetical protein
LSPFDLTEKSRAERSKMNPKFRQGAAVVVVMSVALVAALGAASAARSSTTAEACPAGALVLPKDGVAHASRTALASAGREYRGLKTGGASVTSAKRATVAGPRGQQVGRECGERMRARTVVVELRFPRMEPSASLSEGVVDVSRFSDGYRVWRVVH